MTQTTEQMFHVCSNWQHGFVAFDISYYYFDRGNNKPNKPNIKHDLIFIPFGRREKTREQNTMARPSKDLFLQFQEHLNNEQEVREVRLINKNIYLNWKRRKFHSIALYKLIEVRMSVLSELIVCNMY